MRDLTRRAERTTHQLDVGRRGEAYLGTHEGMDMEGDGIFDILKSAGSLLGRFAGSKVGKDVIGALQSQLPQLAEAGVSRLSDVIRGRPRAQQQDGEGLMLAGQRGRAMGNPALMALDPMAFAEGRKPRIPKKLLENMGVDVGSGLNLAGRGMRKKKGHSKKMAMMNYM